MSTAERSVNEVWSDPDEDVIMDEEEGSSGNKTKQNKKRTNIGNLLFDENSVGEAVPMPKKNRVTGNKRKGNTVNGDNKKKSSRKRLKRHSEVNSFIDDEAEDILDMNDSSENEYFSENQSDRDFIVDNEEEIEADGESVEPPHAYSFRQQLSDPISGRDEVEKVPHYGSKEYEEICRDELKIEIMNPKDGPLPPFLGGVLEAQPEDFDDFYGKIIPESEDVHESLKGATCVLPGLCYPPPDELTAKERDKIPKQDAFPAIFRKDGKYIFAKRNRTKKATTWKSFTILPKSLIKRAFHFCEDMPSDAPEEITVRCFVPCWRENVVMKLPFGVIAKMYKFKRGGKKKPSSISHKKSNLGKRTNKDISSDHTHSVKSVSEGENGKGDVYDELDKEIERVERKLPGNGNLASVEGLAEETRRRAPTPPPIEKKKRTVMRTPEREKNVITTEPLRRGKTKTTQQRKTPNKKRSTSEKSVKKALSDLLKCKSVEDVLKRITVEVLPDRVQKIIDHIREDSEAFMHSPKFEKQLKDKGINAKKTDDPYETWFKAKGPEKIPLRPENYTYKQLMDAPGELTGIRRINHIAQSPQIVFQIFMSVYRYVAMYHTRKEKAYNQAMSELLETLRQTASSDGRRIKALNEEIEKLKKEKTEIIEKEKESFKKEIEALKKKNKSLENQVNEMEKEIEEQKRKDIGEMEIEADF